MVKAINILLESDIQSEPSFNLTDEQIAILDQEHHLHVSGQTKSYSRSEAIRIIKGER